MQVKILDGSFDFDRYHSFCRWHRHSLSHVADIPSYDEMRVSLPFTAAVIVELSFDQRYGPERLVQHAAIMNWLKRHTAHEWFVYLSGFIEFEDVCDAVHFKLAWSGPAS